MYPKTVIQQVFMCGEGIVDVNCIPSAYLDKHTVECEPKFTIRIIARNNYTQ